MLGWQLLASLIDDGVVVRHDHHHGHGCREHTGREVGRGITSSAIIRSTEEGALPAWRRLEGLWGARTTLVDRMAMPTRGVHLCGAPAAPRGRRTGIPECGQRLVDWGGYWRW